HHAYHRPKRFLVIDTHFRCHLVNHRGPHQHAFCGTSRDYLSTLALCILDQLHATVDSCLIDHRTECGITLCRIPHSQGVGALSKLGYELIRDGFVDDDPLGRHTDLALVHKRTEYCCVHCVIDDGIVENDKRCLATQ